MSLSPTTELNDLPDRAQSATPRPPREPPMKFGKQLGLRVQLVYQDGYLDYRGLKRQLATLLEECGNKPVPEAADKLRNAILSELKQVDAFFSGKLDDARKRREEIIKMVRFWMR